MSLLWTLSLKIGYLKTTLQLTIQIEIDNLVSQLICCKTCIPSTVWWRCLRNWEILSTIYETTSTLPAVPLKVRWWVTIYGTRIRGATSFLYLMNMRAFVGYIWVICPEKIQIIRQNSWMTFSGIIWFFLILGAIKAVVSSQLKLSAKMHSSATSSMSWTFYKLKIDFFVFLHFNCLSSKFSFRKS